MKNNKLNIKIRKNVVHNRGLRGRCNSADPISSESRSLSDISGSRDQNHLKVGAGNGQTQTLQQQSSFSSKYQMKRNHPIERQEFQSIFEEIKNSMSEQKSLHHYDKEELEEVGIQIRSLTPALKRVQKIQRQSTYQNIMKKGMTWKELNIESQNDDSIFHIEDESLPSLTDHINFNYKKFQDKLRLYDKKWKRVDKEKLQIKENFEICMERDVVSNIEECENPVFQEQDEIERRNNMMMFNFNFNPSVSEVKVKKNKKCNSVKDVSNTVFEYCEKEESIKSIIELKAQQSPESPGKPPLLKLDSERSVSSAEDMTVEHLIQPVIQNLRVESPLTIQQVEPVDNNNLFKRPLPQNNPEPDIIPPQATPVKPNNFPIILGSFFSIFHLSIILPKFKDDIDNIVTYIAVLIIYLFLEYAYRKKSTMNLPRLGTLLMLTKSVIKANEENFILVCLNKNSLYLQAVLILFFQRDQGIESRMMLLLPIVLNLLHTLYINRDEESTSIEVFEKILQVTIFTLFIAFVMIPRRLEIVSKSKDQETEQVVKKLDFDKLKFSDLSNSVSQDLKKKSDSDQSINNSVQLSDSKSIKYLRIEQDASIIINEVCSTNSPNGLKGRIIGRSNKNNEFSSRTPASSSNQLSSNQYNSNNAQRSAMNESAQKSSMDFRIQNSSEFILESSYVTNSFKKSNTLGSKILSNSVNRNDSYQHLSQNNNKLSSQKKYAIMEFMLNDLNQSSILCKISRKLMNAQRGSDAHLLKNVRKKSSRMNFDPEVVNRTQQSYNLGRSRSIRFSGKNLNQVQINRNIQRKINIDIIHSSKQFFLGNPFYKRINDQIQKLASQKSQQYDANPSFRLVNSLSKKNWEKSDMGSVMLQNQSLGQSSNVSAADRNRIMNFNNSISNVSLKSIGQIQASQHQTKSQRKRSSSKMGSIQSGTLMLTDFIKDLTVIEQEVMEAKIYQPYFISHNTIIQFEQQAQQYATNIQPEKLSIMDILQTHFQQRKNQNKLFFKVNLGDDLEIQQDKRKDQMSHKSVGSHKNNNSLIMRNQNDSSKKADLNNNCSYAMEKIDELQSDNESQLGAKVNSNAVDQNESSQLIKKGNAFQKKRFTMVDSSSSNEEDANGDGSNYKRVELAEDNEECGFTSSSESNSFRKQLNQSICGSDSSKTTEDYSHDEKNSSNTNGASQTSAKQNMPQNDDQILYFEFEINQINEIKGVEENNLTFLNIKDITQLVKNQVKFFDIVYQEALENNFSHEQMTPLNPILNHSELVKQHLILLYMEKFQISTSQINQKNCYQEGIDTQQLARIVQKSIPAKLSLQQIISIEQSAKSMWYYNTNLISRMKIKKNQLTVKINGSNSIEDSIRNVLWPFEHFIFKRRINIYLAVKMETNQVIYADWNLYELVLFNIIQNSVKYNQHFDGDIVITISCKPKKASFRRFGEEANNDKNPAEQFILETQVIDTGLGIDPDRQKLLFVPFMELKDRIGIMKTQNDNIGIGLACSREICKKMGGDIKLKQSQKGLTVMAFKLPVRVKITRPSNLESDKKSSELCQAKCKVPIPMSLPGVSSKRHSANKLSFRVDKLVGNSRQMIQQLQEFLIEKNYLDDMNYQSNSASQRSNSINTAGLDKLNVNHHTKKIGFQVLEDIENMSLKDCTSNQMSSKSFPMGFSQDKSFKHRIKSQDSFGQHLKNQLIQNCTFKGLSKYSQKNNKSLSDLQLNNFFRKQISQHQNGFKKFLENNIESYRQKSSNNLNSHSRQNKHNISSMKHFQGLAKAEPRQSNSSNQVVNKSNTNQKGGSQSNSQFSQMSNHPKLDFKVVVNTDKKSKSGNSQDKEAVSLKPFLSSVKPLVFDIEEEEKVPNNDNPLSKNYSDIQYDFSAISQSVDISPQSRKFSAQDDVIQPRILIQNNSGQPVFRIQNYQATFGNVNKEKRFRKKDSQILPNSEASLRRPMPAQSSPMIVANNNFNENLMQKMRSQNLQRNLSQLDTPSKMKLAHQILINNQRNNIAKLLQNSGNVFDREQVKLDFNPPEDEEIFDILINEKPQKVNMDSGLDESDLFDSKSDYVIVKQPSAPSGDVSPEFAIGMNNQHNQQQFVKFLQNLQINVQEADLQDVSNSPERHEEILELYQQYLQQPGISDLEIIRDQAEQENESSHDIGMMLNNDDSVNNGSSSRINHKNNIAAIDDNSVSNSSHSGALSIRLKKKNHTANEQECDCVPKILIVEDNEFNMMTVCSVIYNKYEIRPHEAQNGLIAVNMFKEALQKPCNCSNRAYKLIFMDIQMPVMDGYLASEQILKMMADEKKKQACRQNVSADSAFKNFCTIMALTSYTSQDVELRCLKIGMKRVIPKPLNAVVLKEVVDRYFFNQNYKDSEKLKQSSLQDDFDEDDQQ